jgi:hypothetical protein
MMKPWMWPWASLYSAQVLIAMVIFNIIAGPESGDNRGGGPIASIIAGLFFSILTVLLYRARNLFQERTFQEKEVERPED